MKTNLDDPRLTAYALKELDESERVAVEEILAADPEARRWVEEVRRTSEQLKVELQSEECPRLEPQQARVIEEQFQVEMPATDTRNWWTRLWFPKFRMIEAIGVVAVLAVLAALLLPALSRSKHNTQSNEESKRLAMTRQREVAREELETAPAEIVAEEQAAAYLAPHELKKVELEEARRANRALSRPVPIQKTVPVQPPAAAFMPEPVSSPDRIVVQGNVPESSVVVVRGASVPGSKSDEAVAFRARRGDGRSSTVGHVKDGGSAGNGPVLGDLPLSGKLYHGGVGGGGKSSKSKLDPSTGYDDNDKEAFRDRYGLRKFAPTRQPDTESYASITDNPFLLALETPLSTFSIDVDSASYANVRRFLVENQMPPPDSVRIEEMINYFSYDYPQPRGNDPFSVNAEVAGCPWNESHRLVRIGLKGREVARDKRPPSNLVFLIDVSGSMAEPRKLPLLKESLKLLTRQLTENDRVSIVVYAGAAGQVLPSTSGRDKAAILRALDRLQAGGSTHGSAGIRLAYTTATEHFISGGANRVILCTDGDFNVGTTSTAELTRLITEKAKSGVFLSVLGFGTGNYKDSTMEMLADKGNGNYAYIDSLNEGRKVLVEQMSGTLVTIAKDVKIQVEFNPAQVNSYRLIGYENRLLAKEDFNNDKKDAGEIGAGHTVTALYEIVPVGMLPDESPGVDPLKYQRPTRPAVVSGSDELLTLKLRYKQPDGGTSRLLTTVVKDMDKGYSSASTDFKFAAAVAEFGMILRDSPYKVEATLNSAWERTKTSLGNDPEGYRSEFLTLIEKAQRLSGR